MSDSRLPLLVLTGCFLAPVLASQTPLTVRTIATGLSRPLDVQAPRGDLERVFIVSQNGFVQIVKNGTLLTRPYLDVSSLITRAGNEQGLLGLAFHPDYANNGFFYIDYTRAGDGATMVVRYRVSANDPDVADPVSASVVIGPIAQPYSNHNAGQLAFGPLDGYLYVGFGDGGSGGDPGCRAQNGQEILGKMLRLDVNVASGYRIPTSNPFVGNPAVLDEIWALGLRNPWRFSFDRVTGDVYIADVGQDTREEIDFQPAASKGGENYGWKIMEGTSCFGSSACTSPLPCRDSRLVLPIHDYDRVTGRSITGGYVYRGCAIPDLRGTYFFGDYATRRIWSFRYDGKTIGSFQDRTSELGLTGIQISSFGEDARGELYVCHLAGTVYKIVPAAPPPVTDLGFGKVGGNGSVPRLDACGLLTTGNSAEFSLARAPATSLAILVVSSQRSPISIFQGTLVPFPPQLLAHFVTDRDGRASFTVPGGGGPLTIYAQYVLLDPLATSGFGFSNALQVDFR